MCVCVCVCVCVFVCACVCQGVGRGPPPPSLALHTSVENGLLAYSVLVDGEVWLASSNSTNVVWVDGAERPVRLSGPSAPAKTTGADAMGAFESTSFSWYAGGTPITTQVGSLSLSVSPSLSPSLLSPSRAR